MLRLVTLSNHVANVSIEPETLELLGRHVACTIDAAATVAGATEAIKWLGHGPLRGWVEEGKLVTDGETLWTGKEGHGRDVENL